jgi:methionyl-tRNA formyltransferase
MGTPHFAVPSLHALAKDHDIVAVYSQPPRQSDRGMRLKPSPVHEAACALGLEHCVRTPLSFRDNNEVMALADLQPTLLVVVAYGLILPQEVLDIPALMAVNGHASLLPRWRGASPISRAIAAGDETTGVSIMQMQAGLDTGPVMLARKTEIAAADTGGSLHDRLSLLTAEALLETLAKIDDLSPIPQDDNAATWAEKITPRDSEIDFSQTAAEIERQVRAFAPYPGAWFIAIGDDDSRLRLKVQAVRVDSSQSGAVGVLLGRGGEGAPLIAAGDGAVELIKLQPQGKAIISGRDFLNGYSIARVLAAGSI